jgi:hypothetical protein
MLAEDSVKIITLVDVSLLLIVYFYFHTTLIPTNFSTEITRIRMIIIFLLIPNNSIIK